MWFFYIGFAICGVTLLGLAWWFFADPVSFVDACKSKEITQGIECPNCKGQHTRRISGTNKAVSKAMVGDLALNKLKNSWECKTCGYRW